MSWLTDIAGRAEALLDRMDQAAATSIQVAGLSPSTQSQGSAGQRAHETSLTYEPTASVGVEKESSISSKPSDSPLKLHKTKAPTQPYSPVAHPEAPPKTAPTPSSYQAFSKSRTNAPNDDSIFEFLNTPTKEVSGKHMKPKNLTRRAPSTSTHRVDSRLKPQAPIQTQLPPVAVSGERRGPEEEEEGGGEKRTAKEEEVEKLESSGGDEQLQRVREEGEEQQERSQGVREETDDGVRVPDREESVKSSGALGSAVEPLDSREAGRETGREAGREAGRETGRDSHGVAVVQQQPTLVGKEEEERHTLTGSSGPSEQERQLASLQQRLSSVELENKLLKREVSSLNDELGTVLERVREAEEGVALHREEAESLREQATTSGRVIRQLRSHDEDMQATLEARDSQIQVLRKELQELEKRETVLKERLEGQSRDRERLLQDASLSSEASSHAMEALKTQLHQTEEQLAQEREAGLRAKTEFAERESLLQHEQQQLSDSLSAQHRQLALQQAKTADSQRLVQAANRDLQQLRREHDGYKKRAAGILQAKEKLISSLQSGGGGTSGPAHEANLEQLRLEKEAIEVELETARLQGAGLREELQEAEEQHDRELEQLTQQMRELEGSLASERALRRSTQEDLQRMSGEMEAGREAGERERDSLAAAVKEREAEIADLKTRVPATPLSPHSHTELESRLHELTESLIQKQTTLEALSSDKNSLKLQLERTESQLLSARKARPPPTHTAVNGLDSIAPTHIRPMASVLPAADSAHSDSRFRNVRRAMNSLDTFSVRLALFLRRYPYARLFVLLYVVLLHLWVLVVLLTYSPEVHNDLPEP